jgi:hypothetical protein
MHFQPSLRDYSSLTTQPRTPSFGLRPGLSSGRPFRGWIIRVLTQTLKARVRTGIGSLCMTPRSQKRDLGHPASWFWIQRGGSHGFLHQNRSAYRIRSALVLGCYPRLNVLLLDIGCVIHVKHKTLFTIEEPGSEEVVVDKGGNWIENDIFDK